MLFEKVDLTKMPKFLRLCLVLPLIFASLLVGTLWMKQDELRTRGYTYGTIKNVTVEDPPWLQDLIKGDVEKT